MYTYSTEAQRLLLRPLTQDDADACFIWCSDPEVNRYMTYPLYASVDEVHEWLTRMETDPTILLFGIERKTDGLLIGSASISWKPDENAMNLGYNLRRACWGHGYAAEAARAILQTGRQHGFHDFMVCHAIENIASERIIKRCGFEFVRMGTYSKYDGSVTFPANYYRLHLP